MRIALSAAIIGAAALGGCASWRESRARLVQEPPRCQDQTVQVYFEPESAEVTRDGRLVIAQAAEAARGCQVRSVDVTGLADAVGSPTANLELSRRRAEAVVQVLAANGLPPAEFKVAAAGQANATTADGRAAPLRRRADITLRLASPH